MKTHIIKRIKQFVKKLLFWGKLPTPTRNKQPKLDRIKCMEQKLNTNLLKLHMEQAKLKAKQVMAQIRLKKLNLLKKYYQREVMNKLSNDHQVSSDHQKRLAEHHRQQNMWVDFLIRQRPNLAVTLNFNPSDFIGSDAFKIDMVKNKVNQWWKLYLQYHLGPKYQGRSDMSYICVIEHSNTNIHCHLSVKLNTAHITDEIIYDEEQLIQTLWKLVMPSGTVFVSSIWNIDWFKYMVKEFGFENKMFFSLK